jgi:hypothetical protein
LHFLFYGIDEQGCIIHVHVGSQFSNPVVDGCEIAVCSSPFNSRCKVSMARINNMGERGLPCLRPLKCLYQLPRDPFKRIEVEDDDSKEEIQPLHLTPKPKCSSTSIK